MTDRATGLLKPDVLNEKVMSAILELKTGLEHVPAILERVEAVAQKLDTIVSIGVSTRCDAEGGDQVAPILEREGYVFFRGKTNLGLGRRPAPAAV
jgi:spore coat polysaccharide biosynthesis protein SpsF (cytidylyltransferase family)